jgi:hypothetical protein
MHEDRKTRSGLYKINIALWQFGRANLVTNGRPGAVRRYRRLLGLE